MSVLLRVTMQSIIQGNGHLLHDEASATNRVYKCKKEINECPYTHGDEDACTGVLTAETIASVDIL